MVISRNSSFAYKGTPVNEQKIGRELGVKYILEGSVRRTITQIRIGVDLVDASSGTEMWTQRFDRPLQDIFAVQDEIVSKVVTTLGLVLKLKDRNWPREVYSRRTDNLEAFEDYLRGLEYFSPGSKSGDEEARRWFERAIAHDPKFADAYAYLGTTYMFDAISQGVQNNQAAIEHAQEFTKKALDLDSDNSPALTDQIELDLHQGHIERAVADGQREIALNPNSYNGYAALSDALACDGQPKEAIRVAQKGMQLDPGLHAWYAFFIARPNVDMGRYNEAIPLLKEHIAAFRDEFWAHYLLVVAYTESGHRPEAQAEAAEVRRIRPAFNCDHFDAPFKDEAARIRAESLCRKLGFK
jgi:adenylate cyclase